MKNNPYLRCVNVPEPYSEIGENEIETKMNIEIMLNQFAEILYRSYIRKYPDELEKMNLFILPQPELKQAA